VGAGEASVGLDIRRLGGVCVCVCGGVGVRERQY
jgi:hypothetical protein